MGGNKSACPAAIRLLIVTHHRLDGEILAAQFDAHADFCVECATTDIQVAAASCRERPRDVVLLVTSPALSDGGHDISALVLQIGDIPVLLLDGETNISRLTAVLASPSVGYFTRATSFAELADGVRNLAHGMRAFCSLVQSCLECTSAGWRLRSDQPHSPFDRLTRREMEIARLIAAGNSVLQCARALHRSPSTIDNHKARLMKKLGFHKTFELTRLAIREGLIRV